MKITYKENTPRVAAERGPRPRASEAEHGPGWSADRTRGNLVKILIFILLINLVGCDAFVRKFTRKHKQATSQEEMVIAPEEYKGPNMTKEQIYRQEFMFWKAWQDELVTYLSVGSNHKKQIDCVERAIKSLLNMKALLKEEKQKQLDIYINQLIDVRDSVASDEYGKYVANNSLKAERIKREVSRFFDYPAVAKNIL